MKRDGFLVLVLDEELDEFQVIAQTSSASEAEAKAQAHANEGYDGIKLLYLPVTFVVAD